MSQVLGGERQVSLEWIRVHSSDSWATTSRVAKSDSDEQELPLGSRLRRGGQSATVGSQRRRRSYRWYRGEGGSGKGDLGTLNFERGIWGHSTLMEGVARGSRVFRPCGG